MPSIPHERGPESLAAVLRRTTRTPLYCHPKAWSDDHLRALRVQGLEEVYPLHHVIGCPIAYDPLDTELQSVIDNPPDRDCQLHAMFQSFPALASIVRTDPNYPEQVAGGLCSNTIDQIRDYVRHYPRPSLSDPG